MRRVSFANPLESIISESNTSVDCLMSFFSLIFRSIVSCGGKCEKLVCYNDINTQLRY